MRRHVGKLRHTDARVVVMFMQIPGKEDHALVVNTTGLPARLEQYLSQILDSPEGQSVADLGSIMNRRLTPDTGEPLLNAFHAGGLLQRVHVDDVVMYPTPGFGYPLRQILESLGKVVPDTSNNVTPLPFDPSFYAGNEAADPVVYGRDTNTHSINREAENAEYNLSIAQNLLREADDLASTANQKREQAYKYAPQLRQPEPRAPRAQAVEIQATKSVRAPAKTTKPAAKPTRKKAQ
jgi:hypothetical protein